VGAQLIIFDDDYHLMAFRPPCILRFTDRNCSRLAHAYNVPYWRASSRDVTVQRSLGDLALAKQDPRKLSIDQMKRSIL
jgi:hypothetical protein